ncbi:MAG TPA: tetratricopeptide repeat protein [Pyrinomonadaceae bacterium]|nr:tetratricopeptide repeat protein [Pyrinomonadaceae bacterium]
MIGQTLLNYRITEKLGAGGQGTVYKAVDEKLGRTVVIKVLAPELTAREANLRRFEREARLASSLDHPNICTIYGLHELDGLHFIAMQFIEGQNVRELVAGRPLSVASALSIGTQVSDALTAAHSRGIIHRDIKAGNVMVTGAGMAKVLDFGLAKLLDEGQEGRDRTSPENIHLTEMGVPYGTATYAAPEQATGGAVDHRADIFSTGVLLYEMLAGTWPFRGKTSVEVRYAVLHDTPAPVAAMRGDNPPPRLQQIIDRALQKNPDGRYQRMEELRDDLRAVMREQAGLGGAGLDTTDPMTHAVPTVAPRHQEQTRGFGRSFRRWLRSLTGAETQPTSLPPASAAAGTPHSPAAHAPRDIHDTPHGTATDGQKSIAILPFRNTANDPEASFYEFSLADAVITELARLRSLVVRPSSQIVKYQGQQIDPVEAGRELRVTSVLAASFLRAGDQLRVNAQLLDVASGELVWSDRIDASAENIITLQDTIARRIVDGLNLEHTSVERAPAPAPATRSTTAYEEYLRGRDFFGRFLFRTLQPEDCDKAVEHFQRAIQLDQSFALAYSGLGACYANRVLKGLGGPEDYELAEEAFTQALELDPNLVESRMLMVFIYLSRGEKQKARAEVARLTRKAPNEAAVYFVKGALHRLDGEYDRALRSYERLARLDPAARVVASYNRARVMMYQGRYEEALRELDAGAAREPNHPLIKTFRGVIKGRQGDASAAVVLLREVLDEHPAMDGIRPLLAQFLIKQGDKEAGRAELTERVREAAQADHDIAYWLATAYALLGERDAALEWLERAVSLGNENRAWFETDPNWEPLRGEQRFQELMRQLEAAQRERTAPDLHTELPTPEPLPPPSDDAEAAPHAPASEPPPATPSSTSTAASSDDASPAATDESPGDAPQTTTPPPETSSAPQTTRATASAAAYEEYLRGRDLNGRFIYHTLAREDSDAAIEHFGRAVELDPNFALAHCALGGAYANRVIKGFGSPDDYARASDAFDRALALDPQLLEARLHMIFIYLSRGERQKARSWVEILSEEAPNNVGVQFVKGTLHRLSGEYDAALEAFGRMLKINPAERVVVSYNRARVFMYQQRFEDALAELEMGAAVEPNHPLVKAFRAVALERTNRTAESVALLREVLERSPRMDGIRPLLAIGLAKNGEREAARAELTDGAREAASADHDVAYWLATAHAVLGEREEALAWLERAIRLGNENRPWFEANPDWASLHDDPQFHELMRRLEQSKQDATSAGG